MRLTALRHGGFSVAKRLATWRIFRNINQWLLNNEEGRAQYPALSSAKAVKESMVEKFGLDGQAVIELCYKGEKDDSIQTAKE